MAITPIYKEFDRQTGRWLWALAQPDYDKVHDGYACPNCLEDFHGVLLVECPACGHMSDANADFVALPDYMVPEPDPIYSA